jgi:hypothetical protein
MSLRLPALLAASLIAAAGCARKPSAPVNAAPAAPPLSAWPEGRTAPLKITDTLVLSIPLQYERSAIEDARAPHSPVAGVGGRTEARFDFFLPDFSGYTLQNYHRESNPNKVEVVYLHAGNAHEAESDAAGEYPPNMLKRALAGYLNINDYKDQYGLRCYQGRERSARLTCYGRRDEAAKEDIVLTTLQPPYPSEAFPQLQARYFSTRYGGVRIAWRTHVGNLPRWHEIDGQIWKLIDAWNVAQQPGGVGGGFVGR